MADAARARKLGERFQEIVAETIELKVKDPRLGFVTFERQLFFIRSLVMKLKLWIPRQL
jgi:hypothetical protein